MLRLPAPIDRRGRQAAGRQVSMQGRRAGGSSNSAHVFLVGSFMFQPGQSVSVQHSLHTPSLHTLPATTRHRGCVGLRAMATQQAPCCHWPNYSRSPHSSLTNDRHHRASRRRRGVPVCIIHA